MRDTGAFITTYTIFGGFHFINIDNGPRNPILIIKATAEAPSSASFLCAAIISGVLRPGVDEGSRLFSAGEQV